MKTEVYDFFRVEARDGYVVAAFNRPDQRNMWARSEEHEIEELLADVTADPEVKALVLTGTGDHFSGGAHHSDDPFNAYDYYDRSRQIFGAFVDLDKPLVIALNGPASGSGLTFAMLGDIVVCERHVEFRDAHVVGGVVSATGPFLWPPSIGLLRAKKYLLTGDTFSADEAERIGLVSEVVDTGQSLARAEEYAAKLASLPPAGVEGTKRALNRWLKANFEPIFEHALSLEFMRFPVDNSRYGSGFDPKH
ncbi:MAG TPA: enoyl-CoA hydratase/isomerase family protein [Acidimicrobiales bacterium]|jgi:enoyl-CoA hydratase|nr:enoyl-CoA hydratase/isomerase family protein [Acidimicrobiales bacterium]